MKWTIEIGRRNGKKVHLLTMLLFCKNQDFLSSCLLAITITLYYINLSFYSSPSIHYQTTSSFFTGYLLLFVWTLGYSYYYHNKIQRLIFYSLLLDKVWNKGNNLVGKNNHFIHHHSLSWHKNSKELADLLLHTEETTQAIFLR